MQAQAAELLHISGTDFYYPQLTELAARLSQIAPMPGPHRVHYGNSGTEAMEAALKLARYHTKRPSILAFYGAFHGRTMGALSLTCSKAQQRRRFAPLMPGVVHAPFPNLYRRPAGTDAEQYARDAARFIEDQLFHTELPPEECAAIVVEAIQGEGGYLPAPPAFLQELRHICDRHGILLIIDEVQSGMGRTGKWWAIEHSGVAPDMICHRQRHRQRHAARRRCSPAPTSWTGLPGSHASTFGGNPVAIAAAMATIAILEREGLDNAHEVGEHILAAHLRLAAASPTRWRCPRARPNDRHRIRPRQDTPRLPPPSSATTSSRRPSNKESCSSAAGASTLRLCPPLIVTNSKLMSPSTSSKSASARWGGWPRVDSYQLWRFRKPGFCIISGDVEMLRVGRFCYGTTEKRCSIPNRSTTVAKGICSHFVVARPRPVHRVGT